MAQADIEHMIKSARGMLQVGRSNYNIAPLFQNGAKNRMHFFNPFY